MIGRSLGRIQCAMMISSLIGLTTDHVDTHTNIIADIIFRWKLESDVSPGFAEILQEYPKLKKLSVFSSKQRADFFNFGCIGIRDARKSSGDIGGTKKLSRQNCFLSFC